MNQKTHLFKVGDTIRCIDTNLPSTSKIEYGKEYKVCELTSDYAYDPCVKLEGFVHDGIGYYCSRFEKVSEFILQVRRANGIDV